MSLSDEFSDLLITQVVSENKTQSNNENNNSNSDDSEDKVIQASQPPKASTSIQAPATAPITTQFSIHSRARTRKYESQHARDVAAID